jgi:hypothetical protein
MKRILASSCFLVLWQRTSLPPERTLNLSGRWKSFDSGGSHYPEAVSSVLGCRDGMTSKVNPQLANEQISVRLEGLDLNSQYGKLQGALELGHRQRQGIQCY